jgi:hypothetical protein
MTPSFEFIRECDSNTFVFRFSNPSLSLLISDDRSASFSAYAGSPFFEAAQYDGRWIPARWLPPGLLFCLSEDLPSAGSDRLCQYACRAWRSSTLVLQ